MNDDAPQPFDPTVRVGPGTTLLEASAGTGKTHAVASIVVHEVAAGRPLDQLLVVTFTRKATGTLRERIGRRLRAAAVALERPGDPDPAEAADPLLAHLATGLPHEVAQRAANLRRARNELDAATIATTHGFCQQVLASLGVAADTERRFEVVEDVRTIVDEAVDDLFVRRFHAGADEPLFDATVARRIAAAVVGDPGAGIAPVDDTPEDRLRRNFAISVRKRVIDHKRRGRLVTFDDLLSRLAASIEDPARGALVAERLRRRFSMAVVDEFQDTDAVQWRILRSAFGAAPCRLVLVGDPKQAIYAFRGGDVHAYVEATVGAERRGLDTSWRSDGPLLDALDAVLGGAQLGGPSIVHRPLAPRPGAEQPRLLGPAVGAPLTVRLLEAKGTNKGPLRRAIADDLAAEVVRMLDAGTTVIERGGDGEPVAEPRELLPRDIAVLVRRNAYGEALRAALAEVGVPAVVHGGDGVLATPAARDWLALLRAIEQPAAVARVRTVVVGPFVGWHAAEVAAADDEAWEQVDAWLHDWSVGLRTHGVAGLLRRIEADTGLTARLLGSVGGERALADLRHVAELLHDRLSAHPSPVAVLAAWLVDQAGAARGEEHGDARRRLESDADAVAIQTIHGAKGLEFPIVLLPSLWEAPWQPDDLLPTFHAHDGTRQIGVGRGTGRGSLREAQLAAHERERDEEELRLLYVALTRAKHRAVLWWATGNDARRSPFARVLLGRDQATGAVMQELPRRPRPTDVQAALLQLRPTSRGAVDAVVIDRSPSGARREGTLAPVPTLAAARFDRAFDTAWVRTSYSALTQAAHDAGPSLDVPEDAPEVAGRTGAPRVAPDVEGATQTVDEPGAGIDAAVGPVADVGPGGPADPLSAELPLGPTPGGAEVGTLVHEVIERTAFTAADLRAEVRSHVSAGARRVLGEHADVVADGIVAALQTPLGPLFDDRALATLDGADRLDELSFDLPLAGGDEPSGVVTMAAIADVFAGHEPADGPLGTYHRRLADPLLEASVRGFLSGSIDLVARVGERHVVVDYKTNRLAPADEVLTARHYRPSALALAMQDNHYPLQAALYVVALHRYLRWRLPRYEPGRHLGGVGYLFLRGMTGPATPVVGGERCGIFSWRPSTAFVLALSDLLDRGAP